MYARYAVQCHPILDTRISFVHPSPSSVRLAQGTPPGFCNGLDWRALVEDKFPQLAKLREKHFFRQKNILNVFRFLKKSDLLRFCKILVFWTIFDIFVKDFSNYF